jgi:hypothetical protein
MKYEGKLYGKGAGKYFDTGYTAKDWDKLELDIDLLKKEITLLKEGHTEIVNNSDTSKDALHIKHVSDLLLFRKWQKENWDFIYLYSNEFMISEYLKSNND